MLNTGGADLDIGGELLELALLACFDDDDGLLLGLVEAVEVDLLD